MFGVNIFFEVVMLNSNILLKIAIALVDFVERFFAFQLMVSLETQIYLHF